MRACVFLGDASRREFVVAAVLSSPFAPPRAVFLGLSQQSCFRGLALALVWDLGAFLELPSLPEVWASGFPDLQAFQQFVEALLRMLRGLYFVIVVGAVGVSAYSCHCVTRDWPGAGTGDVLVAVGVVLGGLFRSRLEE